MTSATDRPQTAPSQSKMGYGEKPAAEAASQQLERFHRYEGALVDAEQSQRAERGLGLAALAVVVLAIIIAAAAYMLEDWPSAPRPSDNRPEPVAATGNEGPAIATASVGDIAFFRDHGRPPIDAIWQGRMRLASPSEWAGGTANAAAGTTLAYAPQPGTRERADTPFALIDEAERARRADRGGTATAEAERKALAGGNEEEDEEDDEDDEPPARASIPRPLPRPKIASEPPRATGQQTTTDVKTQSEPRAPATQLAPPAIADAAPSAPVTSQRRKREVAQHETQNYTLLDDNDEPEVKLTSLPQPSATAYAPPNVTPSAPPAAVAPSSGQPLITLRTPFGIPYLLQQESVQASCFPPPLVDLIRRVEARYGQKPIVTSGLRDRGRRGSLHRRCLAADIMIPGVSSTELARVARQIPGMGGVGQYCHPNLVHIDIGTPRDWKQGCGGFFALRDGSPSRKP